MSPEDFCMAACQTLALSEEYALEVFDQVDRNQLGYITFGRYRPRLKIKWPHTPPLRAVCRLLNLVSKLQR